MSLKLEKIAAEREKARRKRDEWGGAQKGMGQKVPRAGKQRNL